MKKTTLILLILLTIGLIWATAVPSTQAQDESLLWTVPRLLSTPGIFETSETEIVSDPHGFIHIFWTETNPEDGITSLQYASFDGVAWSQPNDVYASAPDIDIISFAAALGQDGTLHLTWSEGNTGPIFYTKAPALEAYSARVWDRPTSFGFPAYRMKLVVDSKNVLHLMFINFYGQEPGVYYTRSADFGDTWLTTVWIDPDIPTYDTPNVLKFLIDDKDGLHASWYYAATDLSSPLGEWVRYVNSFDGGVTWSSPFSVDRADDSVDELRQPFPGLAVSGDTVHMVYAGNNDTQREHRYSLDRGVTWSETERVMGNLQGQALGDGFANDSLGRVHFFGQIRWPQGVYHTTWDPADPEAGWTTPQMAYVISRSPEEGREGRYHAHSVRAGTINGNILVVTFTDEATGPLYVIWRKLEDAPEIAPLAMPTATPTPEATATPATNVTPTPTPPPFAGTDLAVPEAPPNAGLGIWLGVLPTLLLIGGIFGFRMYRLRNS
ncbi:sialidase family protein [Candidatus Leptofilum sp.]|uniref:sialidase family protein n=1 Tax=Candidatus Leptofilum sp. TaxID=3241576 RepID=UPI003B59489A